jgi:hypothetical protein
MAKYSSILVAILLSFTVVQAELPAAAPGKQTIPLLKGYKWR